MRGKNHWRRVFVESCRLILMVHFVFLLQSLALGCFRCCWCVLQRLVAGKAKSITLESPKTKTLPKSIGLVGIGLNKLGNGRLDRNRHSTHHLAHHSSPPLPNADFSLFGISPTPHVCCILMVNLPLPNNRSSFERDMQAFSDGNFLRRYRSYDILDSLNASKSFLLAIIFVCLSRLEQLLVVEFCAAED
jgi:hypothetical protein